MYSIESTHVHNPIYEDFQISEMKKFNIPYFVGHELKLVQTV